MTANAPAFPSHFDLNSRTRSGFRHGNAWRIQDRGLIQGGIAQASTRSSSAGYAKRQSYAKHHLRRGHGPVDREKLGKAPPFAVFPSTSARFKGIGQ